MKERETKRINARERGGIKDVCGGRRDVPLNIFLLITLSH